MTKRSISAARRRPAPSQRVLRLLGLHGLDHLDAVILAALAAEAPLLLIGPHGSAKSALLNRTALALGLSHRHYNASLVSFDDLLGFPVPNATRDGLDYLRTPASLWGAQSVFLDEISRCRPEVQNKLFAIVHERRAMGVALEGLRYRWAAMNPPASDALAVEADDDYFGSQPLDPALADRFAFVVSLPSLDELEPPARRRLIAEGDDWQPEDGADLAGLVEQARKHSTQSREGFDDWVVRWVGALVAPLAQAGWSISGRRAAMLRTAVHAVHGAGSTLAGRGSRIVIADSALDALRWSLPQRAQGRAIAESKLLAVHRKAVDLAGEPEGSPLARIEAEPDPLRRIVLAVAMPEGTLSRASVSSLVADAFAAQDLPGRYLLSRHLLSALSERGLVDAPTLELLAGPLGKVVEFERDASHRLQLTRSETTRFNALLAVLAKLDANDQGQASLGNLLYTLFVVERVPFDPGELVARDAEFARLLALPTQEAAA